MNAQVTTYDGRVYALPAVTNWQFRYALGTPCDSFELTCLWEPGAERTLADAVRFQAEENGERVFTGVVDECACIQDKNGNRLELSGRGLQALLLDNEALPAEYQLATAEDIVRRHVTPYGIALSGACALKAVAGFTVRSGQSEWSVVHDFACYRNGVTPRFDREGRLVLSGWEDTERRLEDAAAVTALRWGCRRYGVLSQVVVRDRVRGLTETVDDREFQSRGGRCRRVVTAAGRSASSAMRYSGAYQLRASRTERETVEVTLAGLFAAWPGEKVRVERTRFGGNGTYRVRESAVGEDADGRWTRLWLGPEDILI